jgi:O-antigen/teichoic acid export membrane protein
VRARSAVAQMATSAPSPPGQSRLREHLNDRLYRTGYFLIVGTGVTSLLGAAFWALAARSYSAHEVGLNAAAISAMTLVSGVCSLGLSSVLVRYLPIAGTATRRLIAGTYAITVSLSLAVGAAVALSSEIWSPSLSFLGSGGWLVGFTLATAATTVFTLQDSILTGLRSAQWIPLENSLFAVGKLALLVALASLLPTSGTFVAWNLPLLPAIVLVNYLIFRRLIPRNRSFGSLERSTVFRMAASNYTGNIFALAGNLYLPVLVANMTSAAEAAYFYVPWLFSLSLQLVALNVMTSLTVEAAIDMPSLRRLARRALMHSMRLVLPMVAVTFVAAPWVLLVFGQDYADAGTPLLRWLAVGAIPAVIVSLGISVARVEHRGLVVVASQAAHAVAVIALSTVLLSDKGIVAVGIAWTGSQALLALLMLATILRPVLFSKEQPEPLPGGSAG